MNERLKILRKALGLKQREVAERLDVRVGLVGMWEAGRPIPKTRVYQLCKEFNVRREWLENGTGDIFEPGKTLDDKLIDAACALFDELSERGQNAVLAALRERIESEKNAGRTQANYGTINGNMNQF